MSDPVTDLKHELLAAAERQHRHTAVHAGRRRWRGHPGRTRLLLTAATIAIAAAVALLFTAPWSNSPSFLARAQAALTPSAGMILHEKWQLTSASTDPACTVTRDPSEIWIDETPPSKYRVLMNDFHDPATDDPGALACSTRTSRSDELLPSPSLGASELAGTLDPPWTIMFVPPNTLRSAPLVFVFPPDPVTELREAIGAGRAHDEGKTQLHGRTVERIRLDPPYCPSFRPRFRPCPSEPIYAYVEPETFYPIQTEADFYVAGVRVHVVTRVLTFEYLPRTDANLALTDIKAQHPNATGVAQTITPQD
jgi:hypothetical protein